MEEARTTTEAKHHCWVMPGGSDPSWPMGSCALATSGADSGRRNTCTEGAEATAEPQGLWDL